MVYGLPCHFASNGIGIWAERIVPILTKFIASYVEETQEDMGLLLKRLAIDIDRADYTLFVNQYYMRMAKEANKRDIWIIQIIGKCFNYLTWKS